MKWIRRALREPLLHFLILAAGLFVVARFRGETPTSQGQDQIVINQARILNIAQMWHRTWQRPPTEAELDGLIDDYINEEVLYREALKMGLDRDDAVIRRRLRQKLEFVAEDLADAASPTDEELQEFLNQHQDMFRIADRVTFSHVYLDPQRRGDALKDDIVELLDKLRKSEEPIDPTGVGDRFLLSHHYDDLSAAESAKLFGPDFFAQLEDIAPNQWGGPIESGYGVHLVRLHDRSVGRDLTLDAVREDVLREWHAARRAESKEQFYQGLRERYEVVIQMPVAGAE